MSRLQRWLRILTIDQWTALCRDWPLRIGTPREQAGLVGLYVVVSLVLMFNEYAAIRLWQLWMDDPVVGSEAWRHGRRMGWVWGVSVAYIVPTAAYAWWALGISPRDLGLRLKGFVEHTPLYLAFFLIVLPFVVWFSSDPQFMKTYPLNKAAALSLSWLVAWELSYAFQFLGVEFFFRGFMILAPARWIGPYAIPVMLVPYCMLHFGKPWPEALGAIIAGAALGMVALRTRSILAGVCIHAAIAWSMDALALWHKGDLSRLLGYG